MIFDFVLNVLAFLLSGVASLLPTFTVFPANLATQLTSFMAYINGWSWIFPVETLLTVFAVLVLVVFAEFTFFVAMYVLGMIHASVK